MRKCVKSFVVSLHNNGVYLVVMDKNLIICAGGRVLTWGRGSCGQLGHGEMVNSLQPQPVQFFEGLFVTHVSAGWNHSGFVTGLFLKV